jgi:Tol biopolymer transport system component
MKQGGFGVYGGVLAAAAAIIGVFPAAAIAAPNETTLVSRANGPGGAKQNGTRAADPAISADGRFVAFVANGAANLPGGSAPDQIYLRDTQTGTTRLVSQDTTNANVPGNFGSGLPSVSADGKFVAFESTATNLIPPPFTPELGDLNGTTDVFVRDMQANTTVLASRNTNGTVGDAASTKPSISGNGRFVAFQSNATNLSGGNAPGITDVFVRDVVSNSTALISQHTSGTDGNGNSTDPSVSGDGMRVAFDSQAANLDSADSDATDDVFIADLQEQVGNPGVFVHATTTLASRADGANGAAVNGQATDPSLSGDGQHIAFSSSGTNLDAADTNSGRDVYKRDLQAVDTSLVSREDGAAGPRGDNVSGTASISGDGRFVAFESSATNLAPDDGAFQGVYLRDTQAGDTILLSRASGSPGTAANDRSDDPSISTDGKLTAFYSFATNLDGADPGDDNDAVEDVYTREADVDIVAPAASITSAPAARTADNTPTVGFASAAGDVASFECSVDNGAFSVCAGSTITTAPLADGAHNVRVRAVDTSANRGTPVTAAFTVDTAGPSTQIDSAPPATVTSNTATVGFSSPAADTASFQCSVDGTAFAPCSSPFTTPALADGAHTVDVRALDDLGNVGSSQRASFTVDTPDPTPDPSHDPPSNDFTIGKAKLNEKKGNAKLPVDVPGAGELDLEGKGVKPATKDASGEGTVNLPVKPKGKTAGKLEDEGKAKVSVEVTFTPTGGDANTQSKTVKLKLD